MHLSRCENKGEDPRTPVLWNRRCQIARAKCLQERELSTLACKYAGNAKLFAIS